MGAGTPEVGIIVPTVGAGTPEVIVVSRTG